MTHPNRLTMQYGTESIWSRRQDTRCSNYGLIPSQPLGRSRPLRMKLKKVTFYMQLYNTDNTKLCASHGIAVTYIPGELPLEGLHGRSHC